MDCLPDSGVALTTAVSAPLPHEVRLYEAQRAALHGRPDTDRPVSRGDVVALAGRLGLVDVSVTVDGSGLDPLDAVAIPRARELRFHPESLILWIAIHEVTHLLLPVSAGHGATFVSTMVRVVVAECGQPAGDRFRAELLRHAVPQLPRSASAGVFILCTGDRFLRIGRLNKVSSGPAPRASRLSSRSAAERAAQQARAALGTPVDIVQLV